MSFRDERDAQRERIEGLERALAEAERARDQALKERDEARADLGKSDAERHAALVARSRFARGAKVLVEWGGKWWKSTVIEVVAGDRWRIHYDGWSDRWDETVDASRIAPADAPAPGPVASSGITVLWALVASIVVVGLAVLLAALLR
jgi:hypothetical protein